jgi:type IV pilus assembly protein PilO
MELKFNIDFKELELREVGTWPTPLRAAIVGTVGLLALVLFANLLVGPVLDNIMIAKNNIVAMKQDYSIKHNIAANLDEYRVQMVEMQQMYDKVLHEIPANNKIPELVSEISKEATAEGLKYELIRPGASISKDNLFMELPVSLKLIGSYHGFGRFLSRLAALDRVLTVHDFTITKINDPKLIKDNEIYGQLIFEVDIKAYWLVGDGSNA